MNRLSALEIAAAVKSGRISAETVIRQALADIVARDDAINAFTAVLIDQALADARQLDRQITAGQPAGALAGVPFAVKNLFDIAGLTTLAGSKILADDAAATQDAVLVRRMKSAGAILVGALNMDEFAYGFVTENAHYGATKNPHDLTRIAGGSSGGSAAAVAAGLVPLTLGSDTNGSIRVPAALCGIWGLKPTYGRLSPKGAFPFVESLDHVGPFARTVADLATAYDACLEDTADALTPRLEALGATPLRVGVLDGWFTQGATSEVTAALDTAAKALDAHGPVELTGAEAARSAAFCMSAYEGGRLHRARLATRLDDFDPAVGDRLLAGALLPDDIHAMTLQFRDQFRAALQTLFERFDVLLAPATPCTAPKIGQSTMMIDGQEISVRKNLGAYTQPISFAGAPVIAGPVNRPGRLPIGIQLIAAPGREDLSFAAALRLERAGVLAAHLPREAISGGGE